jgi:hypothetical protein
MERVGVAGGDENICFKGTGKSVTAKTGPNDVSGVVWALSWQVFLSMTRINVNIYIIVVHTCFYVVLKPEYTNYWICLEW